MSQFTDVEAAYALKQRMYDEQIESGAPANWTRDFPLEKLAHDLNNRDERIVDEAINRAEHVHQVAMAVRLLNRIREAA
jgi:hypothetical protein